MISYYDKWRNFALQLKCILYTKKESIGEYLMTSNEPDKSKLFINKVDGQTREQIIQLDQKLRMARAEIEAKLASIELYNDSKVAKYKDALLDVQQEINAALEGISSLVNMVVEPELEETLFQAETIDNLRQMLSKNLEKVSTIKNIAFNF